jgi:hypothetical protein
MTSLSRRKRQTTAPRITRGRTIFSLLGLAGLAAGQAVADPAPLRPLTTSAPATDLRDTPPLMPTMKATMPNASSPAKMPAVPAKTFYYQKDATNQPAGMMRVNYQDPATTAPASTVPQLPAKAVVYQPPPISDIAVLSDTELQRTIIREADEQYKNKDNIFKRFPEDYKPLTTQPFTQRVFPPAALRVEPTYLCFDRLYFEDKNTERYGWELGPLQPFVSTAKFFGDLVMLPYHFGTRPCQRFETNAGECLPGDPVPYLIYPVELSLSGAVLEAGTVVGLAAIFP